MKTELKFMFDEDDSEDKIHRLTNCDGAYIALYDFQQFLRSEEKYNDDLPEEVYDYLDILRTKLYDVMEENNVNLDRDFS